MSNVLTVNKLEDKLKNNFDIYYFNLFPKIFSDYLIKRYYFINKLDKYKLYFISYDKVIRIKNNNTEIGYISIDFIDNKLNYEIKILNYKIKTFKSYKSVLKYIDSKEKLVYE